MPTTDMKSSDYPDDGKIDEYLDAILRAAGSALKHYTLEKSKTDMRAAMRTAYRDGWLAGAEAMLTPGSPAEQALALERGRQILALASVQADDQRRKRSSQREIIRYVLSTQPARDDQYVVTRSVLMKLLEDDE